MSRTVSVSEAADMLGCSTKTVRRLVKQGRLDAFKYGDATSRLWVSHSSVAALMEASRIAPAADTIDLIAAPSAPSDTAA